MLSRRSPLQASKSQRSGDERKYSQRAVGMSLQSGPTSDFFRFFPFGSSITSMPSTKYISLVKINEEYIKNKIKMKQWPKTIKSVFGDSQPKC